VAACQQLFLNKNMEDCLIPEKFSPLTTFYYSGIAFSKGLRAKTIVLLLISQQEKSKLASSLQDSLKQWMFSRCVSMQKIVS
jgi:hypothetical protein